ncbi:hypothetical protein LCGC14_2678640 [marine sediment metagenome]|uniref:Uncharacterized protein n=1 Tax=marine sediment metagenome TaxID=412755 RepID=A0A0F9CDV8_9ZZZZ
MTDKADDLLEALHAAEGKKVTLHMKDFRALMLEEAGTVKLEDLPTITMEVTLSKVEAADGAISFLLEEE